MKFKSFYVNRPEPVCCVPDTETKFVDQSEADRASLKFQLERFGMDSLQQQLDKTRSQFGYADTRLVSDFATLNQKMAEANSYFMELPSRIRAKFDHSAVKFFSEVENDPSTAYKSGFISKKLAADLGVKDAIDKPIKVEPTTVVIPTRVVTPTVPTVPTVPTEPTGPDNNNVSAI